MTREQFENNTNYKMSYEEFQKCDCTQCDNKDCIHRNTILIHMQRPDATAVAGFNAWKKKFQRNVKKGEKGITILAP